MYNIGDKVKIKKLDAHTNYGGLIAARGMAKNAGREATVTDRRGCEKHIRYRLDVDDGTWQWTDEMLEPAEPAETEITAIEVLKWFAENDLQTRKDMFGGWCNVDDILNEYEPQEIINEIVAYETLKKHEKINMLNTDISAESIQITMQFLSSLLYGTIANRQQ